MPKDPSSRSKKPAVPPLKIVKGGREASGQDSASEAAGGPARVEKTSHGKRVQFDLETWHVLNVLGRDRMMTFQELADEAFADLLGKHGRPRDLQDALKRSVQAESEAPKRRR